MARRWDIIGGTRFLMQIMDRHLILLQGTVDGWH